MIAVPPPPHIAEITICAYEKAEGGGVQSCTANAPMKGLQIYTGGELTPPLSYILHKGGVCGVYRLQLLLQLRINLSLYTQLSFNNLLKPRDATVRKAIYL